MTFLSKSNSPLIRAHVFSFLFLLLAGSVSTQAFNCKQIKQFTDLYLKLHYSAETFDDTLSERTLSNFLKALDPAKMYFIQSDVDNFTEKYQLNLDDFIHSTDCRGLNVILQTYSTRFKAQQPKITELIDAEHDFTIDEFYDVDRKKRAYASSNEELQERWRKQVKLELLRLKKRFEDIDKAREKLKKRYELSQKYLYELDAMELASIFLNAYSTSLDPHSKYLSAETLEDFHISTGLSLEGIGAVLRSEYGMTTIQSLVPGGPAQQSGELKEGDTIVAVSQGDEDPIDVVDMKLRDVVKHIRGNRGTEVRLSIEREEKDKMVTKVVSIIRDKIELTDKEARGFAYQVEVKNEDTLEQNTYNIGLIQLPSFYTDFEARKQGKKDYKSSVVDIRRLITELGEEHGGSLDALIVDLRFNSGGSLDEAINIAGLFFDEGPVVQVHNTNGDKQVLADTDGETFYNGPLTLLINRQSASSSEILAGAIKDYKRGLIVGNSHSFGKGTVQTVKDIAGGKFGAIKVTISQFYRPGGHSTQLRGVDSDIVLPDLVDELELGEKFYDYHLPWNEIEEAPFQADDRVSPYLDTLKVISQARVEQDEDFKKILQDIVEYHEKDDTRTQISLKEEEEEEEAEEETEENTTAEAEIKEDSEAEETGPIITDQENEIDNTEEESVDLAEDKEEERRPQLDKDIVLREALAITSDYIRLLQNKPTGIIHFPELKDIVVAEVKTLEADAETTTE